MSSDLLTIKGLKYHALHGFHPFEKVDGNDFEVDLIFDANLQPAAASDDLNDTLDYQVVEEAVTSIMNGRSVNLIETLCKRIGDAVFEKLPMANELTVKLRKLHPPMNIKPEYSEIVMQWQRS